MGLTASKSKNNVTLIRSLSKKSLSAEEEEVIGTPNSKIMITDPRSPPECFNRTPIVIPKEEKIDSTQMTPLPSLKVLEVDPRSPLPNDRTPIVVQESSSSKSRDSHDASLISPKEEKKGKLANICTSSTLGNTQSNDEDPRSPTGTVPRTPLQQKSFDESENLPSNIERQLSFSELSDSIIDDITEEKKTNKLGSVDSNQSTRTPLRNLDNPKNFLLAKQCKNLEDEFTKNQQTILKQVNNDQENSAPIKTTTQFVEEI